MRAEPALWNYHAEWDRPDRVCPEGVQARIDQLDAASIFAVRRWIDGDRPSSDANEFAQACVHEALHGE